MRKLLSIAMPIGAILILSLVSSVANANAFVLNTGRDGLTCSGNVAGFTVVGDATLVVTESNQVTFSCHGDVFEEPPEDTLRFDDVTGPFGSICKAVITKSGKLNATCHN